MAKERDRYRNPDAPPGSKMPVFCPSEQDEDPILADLLRSCMIENEPNKLYFEHLDMTIDLSVLLKDTTLTAEDTDFSPESSDEGELESHHEDFTEYDLGKVKVEKKDFELMNLRKRIKSESDYSSDSENHSFYDSKKKKYKKKKKRKSRSSSRSESYADSEDDNKASIKLEQIEPPQHLFGSYTCEVCNIKMTSQQTYESHISGKRHLKALRFKNLPNTVLKTIPRSEADSRYPIPPPGIIRMPSREKAKIQDVVETRLEKPCPALHKVIEIQGLTEIKYYCTLCDAPCDCNCIISHLSGYKHRLHCLKYLRPEIYADHTGEVKYRFEDQLNKILKSIQKVEGMGKMSVEKEIARDAESSHVGRRDIHQPSTSSLNDPRSSSFHDIDDVRDYSKPGFYCQVCQAAMNSEAMWESHLSGKRHLANLKKHPGSLPSKMKSISLPNKPSKLRRMLIDEHEPIVGLDHIVEIQNPEINKEKYQCLLCSASFTSVDIRDHLVTEKHRKKYLKQIDHEDYELIDNMHVPESHTHSLVADICDRVEREIGCGHPEVRVVKDNFKL